MTNSARAGAKSDLESAAAEFFGARREFSSSAVACSFAAPRVHLQDSGDARSQTALEHGSRRELGKSAAADSRSIFAPARCRVRYATRSLRLQSIARRISIMAASGGSGKIGTRAQCSMRLGVVRTRRVASRASSSAFFKSPFCAKAFAEIQVRLCELRF